MAHELSMKDGRAEMAYAGETPWHGLGQQVTKGASIGVWAKEAGMEWTAREAQVVFTPHEAGKQFGPRTLDSHKILYRSDTHAPLGVVGKDYRPVQPREVLEFFRGETERDGWYIHTAGVLRGGRKLWAMATNGREEQVAGKKGDRVKNNLLLATALDGSMKTVAKLTSVVVVCANTLAMAMSEGGSIVTVSHRSQFDARAVKRALGVAEDSFSAFIAQARDLADTPIRLDDAQAVLERVFGKPPAQPKGAQLDTSWLGDLAKLQEPPEDEDEEQQDPRISRSVVACLSLFKGQAIGAGLDGRQGTKWGLLNAVTEYVDHEMGRTRDSRLDQAWFGRGDSYKRMAFEALAKEAA